MSQNIEGIRFIDHNAGMSIAELEQRFGVPGLVRIEEGRGSLPRVTVTSDLAEAELYFHGAHLTRYQPRGSKPVIFTSQESLYDAAKPIRGGVPVIFPWFGPKAGSPESPMHGFARIRDWDLESCTVEKDGAVRVAFRLSSDEATLRLWPFPFLLRMSFRMGRQLEMDLDVQGAGTPFPFEEALHTYFSVGDVRQASVEGLAGAEYLDKTDSFRRKLQPAEPIRITGETDRVYLNTTSRCIIRDPVLERTISVEKEHSGTTVVWNPWIAKAKAMADFGDDEWPEMLCVESANVGEGAVKLGAAETHQLRVRIQVSR